MRPRGFYVVWDRGRVIAVVRGAAAARKRGPAYKGFKTRLEAEEFAAWWNHREEKRVAEVRAKRLNTTERTA